MDVTDDKIVSQINNSIDKLSSLGAAQAGVLATLYEVLAASSDSNQRDSINAIIKSKETTLVSSSR